jgi:hypothetical protein
MRLYVDGVLLAKTEAGEKLLELSRGGLELQASVGIAPGATEYIQAGQKIKVNGREIESGNSGFTLIKTGKLREVSLTPLGCDDSTRVSIAAKQQTQNSNHNTGVSQMTIKELRAHAQKYDGIVAKDLMDGLILAAMDNEDTIEKFDERVLGEVKLAQLRASRSQTAPAGHISGKSGGIDAGDIRAAASAGVLMAAGRVKCAEKMFGPKACQLADDMGLRGYAGAAEAALLAAGKDVPKRSDLMIQAALSYVGLAEILGPSMEKTILFEYEQLPATWRPFTKTVPVKNFRPHPILKADTDIELLEIADGGELKHSDISEENFAELRAATFGRVLKIGRQTMVNDDLSVFDQLPVELAKGAYRTQSDLIWKTFMNNSAFFKAANGNLPTPNSNNVLSFGGLDTAVLSFRKMIDKRGWPISVVPRCLIVAPENESTARQLLNSQSLTRDTTNSGDNLPEGNPMTGLDLQLIVEPRLSNTKFTGNSGSTWYLTGGQQDAVLTAAFLDGIEAPRVEIFGLDHDVDTLAYSFRVYSDFGAKLTNYRAGVKMLLGE